MKNKTIQPVFNPLKCKLKRIEDLRMMRQIVFLTTYFENIFSTGLTGLLQILKQIHYEYKEK